MIFNVNPMGWTITPNSRNHLKKQVNSVFEFVVPDGEVLPFQLSHTYNGSNGGGPYTLTIVDSCTGQVAHSQALTVVSGVDPSDSGFYVIRFFGGNLGYVLDNGTYEARVSDAHGRTWYSELYASRKDLSQYVKIEYSSKYDLSTADQTVLFSDSFKFNLYVETVIMSPTYEYFEEAEEKNGYKFISNQVAKKLYLFTFPASEYLCDAMTLLRLCDFIRITDSAQIYYATEFLFTPTWDEQGDYANAECEFSNASISRKVNAFKNIDSLGQYNQDYNEDYKNQIG